ncbi:phosphatidate phosphatase PAH2-like protein, partial [Tanacetum coccineum]
VTDVSNGQVLTRNNSKRSRIMAFVRGRRSMKENTLSKDENDLNGGRMGSLERAEMAADLLEMRWSTNLSSRSNKNDDSETSKDNGDVIGGRLETGLVLHEQHFVNKVDSSWVDSEVPVMEVKETIVENVSKAVDEESSKTQLDEFIEANVVNKVVDEESSETQLGDSVEADVVNEVVKEESSKTELDDSDESDVVDKTVDEESLETQLDDTNEPEVGLITAQGSLEIVPESYAEAGSNQGETSVEVVSCSSVSVPFIQTVEESLTKEVDETNEIRTTLESNGEFQDVPGDAVLIKEVSERVVEQQLILNDLDDSKPSIKDIAQKVESTTVIYCPDPPPVRTHQERPKADPEGLNVNTFRRCPTYVDFRKSREITENDVLRRSKSLPNMWSHVDDIVPDNLEEPQFYSPVGKFRSSNWDLIREDALRIHRENSEKKLSQSGDNVSKDLKDGSIPSGGPADIVDGAGGSWSLWPFRRSASKSVSEKKDSDVDSVPEIDGEKEDSSPKLDKTHKRALAPTAEQLASLNLAQGQNTVTFTFSTSVLGAQKVDARIYLWRWDTRIVISDVDGTITK